MNFLRLAALALVLYTFSCKNATQQELETLNQALIVGHDEVMPKSMAIPTIREKMMKAVENAPEDKTKEALEISTALLKAEDKMNVWMVEFGDAMEIADESAKLVEYKKLNEEIIQLKTDTEEAIQKAKDLTAEFEK